MRPALNYLLPMLVASLTLGAGIQSQAQCGSFDVTYPEPLNLNAYTDGDLVSIPDIFPQVTTDGSGNWVAVWTSTDRLSGAIGGSEDILVARSTDNGVTWTYPEALNGNIVQDESDRRPQVTTDGSGNWVAVWESTDTLGGTIGFDWDILVARSTDNGITWTYPVPLNGNAYTDSGTDFISQVTTDGSGNWIAVWYSNDTLGGTIGTDIDVLVARSTDNGITWTYPEPLNGNAYTDSGNDFSSQVTTDGSGNWVAVWTSQETLGGTIGLDQDILVARSTDNGITWTYPEPLNINADTDSLAVDRRPQVTTDGLGNWVAVWDSKNNFGGTIGVDEDILVARSTNNGITWTYPEPLNINAYTDSGTDFYSQVTTDGSGNWIAVWRSDDTLGGTIGGDRDILVARSTNNGMTWTYPEPLNGNACTDNSASASDDVPQVTTDGSGNWVAVWTSTDDLGGTIDTDIDVLVARWIFCIDPDGDGFSTCDGDCNEAAADVYPGAPQLCDGINNDCNDPLWPAVPLDEIDSDGDGYPPCGGDCDDMLGAINPDGFEICNARDDDCDGLTDEDANGLDVDADGVAGLCDNCPTDPNADQADMDADTVGDVCDNCIAASNQSQSDFDSDFTGDRCDDDDGVIYVWFDTANQLDWQSEGFSVWNAYRGDLNELRISTTYTQVPGSNALAAQMCGLTGPVWLDSDAIPPGLAAFYLSTGDESELGQDSSGTPRPNDNPCP